MKKVAVVLITLVGAIALYVWHFPLWFNYVLSDAGNIDVVIAKLGEPDKVVSKDELHKEIVDDDKSQGADKAYYWSNGSSSYHYVVTNRNGEIINYSSRGW